jgi:enoyl-CoA hydratase
MTIEDQSPPAEVGLPDLGAYAAYTHLKFDRPEAGILEVILSNPGKLNATSPEIHRELAAVWLTIDRDPDTRAVIVRGEGGVFSAGGTMDMVEAIASDPVARAEGMREARDLVYNLINCSKPVISAMDGYAVGAGLAVGLLADIPIATKTVKLMDGHVKLGVAAGDHAPMIWPMLVGLAKAKYYLLTGVPLLGEEAERIGLVALCVDEDDLRSTALDVARKLAAGSRTAIAWTKYSLNNWLRIAGPTFDASVALEFLGFAGEDIAEGVSAVKEKRRPVFEPRPANPV